MVHRYWRLATVLSALLLLLLYLPSPHHRAPATVSPRANAYNATAPTSGGVTIAGIPCRPGVRQAPFSAYSDLCIPRWHGSNGGATAHGVTGTTITLTYREATSSQLQPLYSMVPTSVVGTNGEAVATMQAYIKLFNHFFDLYGRHVVLRPYAGQSNFLAEDSGLDAPEAQADATTAYDLGAFADMSLVDSSQIYVTDLAANRVIAFSLYLEPAAWYRQFAPYEYATGPDCNKGAAAAAAFLGTTVAGVAATDVGTGLEGRSGRIGIIYPDTGQFPACARQISHDLQARYRVSPTKVLGYTVDLPSLSVQAQSIMASLKSSGVTTVVCSSCDPITPQFLAKAAVAEDYFPQWYVEPAFALAGSDDDGFVRLLPDQVVAHVVQPGTVSLPRSRQEAFRALQDAGFRSRLDPTYPFVYAELLMFFDALQNAGPHLTPRTFENGVFAIPASSAGAPFGAWKEGPGIFDPQNGFTLMHWDPRLVSNEDGEPGAFQTCDAGNSFSYDNPVLTGLVRGMPLSCGGDRLP